MCDVFAISPSIIALIEVKASIGTAKAALDKAKKSGGPQPLERGLLFLRKILKALQINENIQIMQLLIVPNPSVTVNEITGKIEKKFTNGLDIRHKLGKKFVYQFLGEDDLQSDALEKLFDAKSAPILTESDLHRLTAACVLLMVGMVNKTSEEAAETVMKVIYEGRKGGDLAKEIIMQSSLEAVFQKQESIIINGKQSQRQGQSRRRSRAEHARKVAEMDANTTEAYSVISDRHKIVSLELDSRYRSLTSEVLFFSPEQARILHHVPSAKQIIFGPAATGKTLLIQAKAVHLVKTNQPVLIILPEPLIRLYEAFFRRVLNPVEQERLTLLSLERPQIVAVIRRLVLERGYGILIDEYFAIVSNASHPEAVRAVHELLAALPADRLCWIAIDPLQPCDEKNFAPEVQIPGMNNGIVSYLLTVQRCTNCVFKQWSKHSGRFVSLGHQHEGVFAETVVVPQFDDYQRDVAAIAGMIAGSAKRLLEQRWRAEDIVILIDDAGLSYGHRAQGDLWEALKKQLAIHPIGERRRV